MKVINSITLTVKVIVQPRYNNNHRLVKKSIDDKKIYNILGQKYNEHLQTISDSYNYKI